jgi:hypothetical protein
MNIPLSYDITKYKNWVNCQLMIETSSKTETFCFYHKHDTCEKDCFDENDSWSIIFSRQCVLSSKCDCCVEPGLIG